VRLSVSKAIVNNASHVNGHETSVYDRTASFNRLFTQLSNVGNHEKCAVYYFPA